MTTAAEIHVDTTRRHAFRVSDRQLGATLRRIVEVQGGYGLSDAVERLNAEVAEIMNSWRKWSAIPTPADVRNALLPRPFTPGERPPVRPDRPLAEARFIERLEPSVRSEHPAPFWHRAGGVLIPVISLIIALPAPPYGAGLFVTGVLAWLIGRSRWNARIEALVKARVAAAWATENARLETEYGAKLAAHCAREAKDRDAWLASESVRAAALSKLLGGDLQAIREAVRHQVPSIALPFESECAMIIDEEDHALADIDLPEIEDVVPELRFSVLKNGKLRESKRKPSERNEEYATLATGIAFLIAATAFAAAPTLQLVTVAGHTQRKNRNSLDPIDTYVFEVRFDRQTVVASDPRTLDPLDAVRRLPSRIEVASNGALKKIAPPAWTENLWD